VRPKQRGTGCGMLCHEDEKLTHVGPGTPCGEYLHRFWQPVALAKGVQELPLRVRLLGEDLDNGRGCTAGE
jgi:hypothetical protein